MASMGGLTDKNEPPVPDELQKRIVVIYSSGNRIDVMLQGCHRRACNVGSCHGSVTRSMKIYTRVFRPICGLVGQLRSLMSSGAHMKERLDILAYL